MHDVDASAYVLSGKGERREREEEPAVLASMEMQINKGSLWRVVWMEMEAP
jgi:hypothetical protein